MRPSTVTGFAAGIAVGSIFIAAVATFTTHADDHLPDCQTAITYTVAP